ncbi:MAG: uroporphyrinogen decarboxylase [Deltaproteobacteria bacterium]|jgi:uroporphyrinogen decarboxylase|nr:uroporphyrinogen decarboxylase [Deltaproteobacteria bacterium]
MTLTSKELMHAVANFKSAERIPINYLSPNGLFFKRLGLTDEQAFALPAEQLADIYIEGSELIKSDVVIIGLHGTLSIKAIGGKVKMRKKGPPDMEEPLLENISDLDKLDIGLLKKDYYYQKFLDTAKHTIRKVGDTKTVCTGGWAPFTLAGLIFGAEKLMRACLKDKPAVRDLMDFCVELYLKNVEDIVEAGADMVSAADPTASGDMISRRVFEELSLPYLQKIYKWVNDKKRIASLHICGNIENRLDLIPDTGTRILSMDYKVNMAKARDILGGKVVLAGNADPVGVIQMGTPEVVADTYRSAIEQAGNNAYIMMTGCSLSALTPMENIEAMTKVAYSHAVRVN